MFSRTYWQYGCVSFFIMMSIKWRHPVYRHLPLVNFAKCYAKKLYKNKTRFEDNKNTKVNPRLEHSFPYTNYLGRSMFGLQQYIVTYTMYQAKVSSWTKKGFSYNKDILTNSCLFISWFINTHILSFQWFKHKKA